MWIIPHFTRRMSTVRTGLSPIERGGNVEPEGTTSRVREDPPLSLGSRYAKRLLDVSRRVPEKMVTGSYALCIARRDPSTGCALARPRDPLSPEENLERRARPLEDVVRRAEPRPPLADRVPDLEQMPREDAGGPD